VCCQQRGRQGGCVGRQCSALGLRTGVTPKGRRDWQAGQGWRVKGLLAALGLLLPQMSEKGEVAPLRSYLIKD